jgi:ABC-type amino acid transport substrate-binding protein
MGRQARSVQGGERASAKMGDLPPSHTRAIRPRGAVWLILALVLIATIGLLTRAILSGRDPTWQRIQRTGVWRVGMDPSFPPFENLDGTTQKPVGLDVDLANAIAAHWGIRSELVAMGFDELVDAVTAHRVDSALSGLPVFEYRTQEVSFSAPYVEAGILLVVPSGSAITQAADLAGRRLSAEWGSAGDAEARELQRQFGGNLFLVLRETPDAALQAVLDGEADAAAADAVSLALFSAGNESLVAINDPLQSDPYVIVAPAGAPKLLAAINEALAALEADGTLDAIRTKWLSSGTR